MVVLYTGPRMQPSVVVVAIQAKLRSDALIMPYKPCPIQKEVINKYKHIPRLTKQKSKEREGREASITKDIDIKIHPRDPIVYIGK